MSNVGPQWNTFIPLKFFEEVIKARSRSSQQKPTTQRDTLCAICVGCMKIIKSIIRCCVMPPGRLFVMLPRLCQLTNGKLTETVGYRGEKSVWEMAKSIYRFFNCSSSASPSFLSIPILNAMPICQWNNHHHHHQLKFSS